MIVLAVKSVRPHFFYMKVSYRPSLVLAAGNEGTDPNRSTLSPWSIGDSVIGVGAAYQDGDKLWEYSSCGIKDSQIYRPWVAAPGVNMVCPR